MLAHGATLTVSCIDALGIATLTWSGGVGPVQINVGKPTGTPLTGLLGPSGTAVTGPWIFGELSFYLVDQSGNVEASATANQFCSTLPPTIDQGLASGSYFPLAVGNTWIYKYNDRQITAAYITRSLSGQQIMGDQTYYVLTETSFGSSNTLALLRADSNGVIYQYTPTGEQVYLNPHASGPANYSGALGVFNDAITPPLTPGGLIRTTIIYARGIGLVNSSSTMLTGSSGGFTESLDLVDVKIDGFHLSVPQPKIALSIENSWLDLTHQKAPNCAVPCYFVACTLAPGADPPNTYRPCAQARVDASGDTVLLELLDPTGKAVFQTTTTTPAYVRLPLYTGQSPFTLLPPGTYTLVGSIAPGSPTAATSSITVQIQ